MPTVYPILASIPSPSDNAISIGGLELRAYGLAIALGVIAAVWISRRRWAARGGDPDDISRIALWAVLAGLIGARLYHVLTDLHRFEGRWHHAFAVWEGGLGIPGGLIAGVGAGAYIAHRRGLPVPQLLDVVAPALPVAQAIGRLGNWFNQELFGRPTDLPWGLEIDPEHRPAGYLDVATFHPTFLYEALWNLALAGGLVLWERHHPARPGRLFALYVAGYAVGRTWVEALRIDPATHLFGVRWNIWMSAIAFFAAIGWLVFDSWWARRKTEGEPSVAAATVTDREVAEQPAENDAGTSETPADTTTDTTGDAVEPPDTETADTAEPPDTETAETAEPPDTETAETAEPPDTETAETAEPPDTETHDTAEPPDTETHDTAEPPAEDPGTSDTPADAATDTTDPGPDTDATTETADHETRQPTDPGPDTDATTETADEEAAT